MIYSERWGDIYDPTTTAAKATHVHILVCFGLFVAQCTTNAAKFKRFRSVIHCSVFTVIHKTLGVMTTVAFVEVFVLFPILVVYID